MGDYLSRDIYSIYGDERKLQHDGDDIDEGLLVADVVVDMGVVKIGLLWR